MKYVCLYHTKSCIIDFYLKKFALVYQTLKYLILTRVAYY